MLGNTKLHYINFANEIFEEQQKSLLYKYKMSGFNVTGYTQNDIDDTFMSENIDILSCKRGCGYWLWKPYLILKKLNEVDNGDVVFYTDCGDDLRNDIKTYLLEHFYDNNMLIIKNRFSHLQYTKKDCFDLMNCNENKFFETKQMEAGVCGFKKCDESISFVKEWLSYCMIPNIINDNYESINHSSFIDHRHDQSILTNLVIKNNIKTIDIEHIEKYISYGSLKKIE